jgi:hypothetical protein
MGTKRRRRWGIFFRFVKQTKKQKAESRAEQQAGGYRRLLVLCAPPHVVKRHLDLSITLGHHPRRATSNIAFDIAYVCRSDRSIDRSID